VDEDKGDVGSILPATVVVGGYCRLPKPTDVVSRAAKVAKTLKSSTPARLYVYDTLLERLAQDLEHMTAKLGQFIQEEHAVVRQRYLARQWHQARRRAWSYAKLEQQGKEVLLLDTPYIRSPGLFRHVRSKPGRPLAQEVRRSCA
jgi:hypothetical protein